MNLNEYLKKLRNDYEKVKSEPFPSSVSAVGIMLREIPNILKVLEDDLKYFEKIKKNSCCMICECPACTAHEALIRKL